MTNDITQFNNVPSVAGMFEGLDASDLQSGTTGGGFPRISIKGSKYRVKPPGRDIEPLVDENGNVMSAVEFVILDYQKGISKIWYEKGYTDGDAEAPDCFSHDGKTPHPSGQRKQADSCVTCPKNQWGSRITDAGKKAKACRDSKRLAVSFATNIDNEELGGPMLLRIPAQSLKDLDKFAAGMTAKGYVPQQIVTRISFDVNASYPKLMFKAVRPLSDAELQQVQKWYHSEQVRDILEGQQHSTQVQAIVQEAAPEPVKIVEAVDTEFEQAAPSSAPSSAPSPKLEAVKSEPVKEEKPANKPSSVDADLDAIMGDLDIG